METKALMIGVVIFGAILLIGLIALNAILPEEIFASHNLGDSEENNSDLVLVQGTPYKKRLF